MLKLANVDVIIFGITSNGFITALLEPRLSLSSCDTAERFPVQTNELTSSTIERKDGAYQGLESISSADFLLILPERSFILKLASIIFSHLG